MRWVVVAIFIISGLADAVLQLAVLGVAGGGGPENADDLRAMSSALTVLVGLTWIICATTFINTAWSGRTFLVREGGLMLPDLIPTLVWFIVPIANFIVPWQRFATIRNSLSNYLKTGEMSVHESGRGATVFLVVFYALESIAFRLVAVAPDQETRVGIMLLAMLLWLISFIYCAFWLITFTIKLQRAKARLAQGGASQAEVFA